MPVDETIRANIDNLFRTNISTQSFYDALNTVIEAILKLDILRGRDARDTSAYLSYKISEQFMRRSVTNQFDYGSMVTQSLRFLFDKASIRRQFHRIGTRNREDALNIAANFYTFHLRLLWAGNGVHREDAAERLKAIVGLLGPWNAHIKFPSDGMSHPNIIVRQMRDGQMGESILIGEIRQTSNFKKRQIKAITWNMQGSSSGGENKWNSEVKQLVTKYDVTCLQECGSMPLSATEETPQYTEDQFGVQFDIREYIWDLGTSTRPEKYTIYYFDIDRLRVKLAIIIRRDNPTNKIVVRNLSVISDGLNSDIRPAFGIRITMQEHHPFNDVTFYSYHGLSGGGYNDPRMVREITRHTPTSFVILGDFNRDPRQDQWISPQEIATIVGASGTTHGQTPNDTMLDYAVSNNTIAPHTTAEPIIPALPSDHRAAPFTFSL